MNFRVTGLRAVAVLKSKFHSDCSSQVESYVRLNEMEPKKKWCRSGPMWTNVRMKNVAKREREKIETRLFNVQDDFQIDNITVEHFRSAL